MPVNGFNKRSGGTADSFKRAFEFRKFPPAVPFGNIAERIIRRIQPVILANGIGDAFRLYLTGAAVRAFRRVPVYIVQRCMGDFVNSRVFSFQFAPFLVKLYAAFVVKATSIYPCLQRLQANLKGRSTF